MTKLHFNNLENTYEMFEKFEHKEKKAKRIESKKDLYRKARNNKQHDKYISWEE